jgi:hypothetical protein
MKLLLNLQKISISDTVNRILPGKIDYISLTVSSFKIHEQK